MTLAGGYSTKAATAGLHTGATWVTDSHSLRLKQTASSLSKPHAEKKDFSFHYYNRRALLLTGKYSYRFG